VVSWTVVCYVIQEWAKIDRSVLNCKESVMLDGSVLSWTGVC
jgi:hypothetical protein